MNRLLLRFVCIFFLSAAVFPPGVANAQDALSFDYYIDGGIGCCDATVSPAETLSRNLVAPPAGTLISFAAGWSGDTPADLPLVEINSGLTGKVGFGYLNGGMTASVTTDDNGYPGYFPTGQVIQAVGTSATFHSEWTDSLTVTSSSLPAGTPVTLKFTYSTGPVALGCGPAVNSSLIVQYDVASQDSSITSTCGAQQNPSGKIIVSTSVGAVLGMEGALTQTISAYGSGNQTTDAFVDPTTSFYAASETPGVSLISASGTNYSPPSTGVPEPPMLWLLLFGISLVAIFAPSRRTPRVQS